MILVRKGYLLLYYIFFARVGGREKYEHCDNCGLCLPKSDGHKCRADISKTNCPVYYHTPPYHHQFDVIQITSGNIILYPHAPGVHGGPAHLEGPRAHPSLLPPDPHHLLSRDVEERPLCLSHLWAVHAGAFFKSIKGCNFVFSQWTGQPWTER